MPRTTLIVLGAVALAGGAAWFLLERDLGTTSRPGPTPEPPALEAPTSRTAPKASEIGQIQPRSFNEEPASRRTIEAIRARAGVISTAFQLLGEKLPPDYLEKPISDDDLRTLRMEIEKFERREREIKQTRDQVGYKRLKEIYDAGGWKVWEERMITIPYPGKPGQTITRNASPYDDRVEDEMISETGANGPDGKLQNRVVRLRPDGDETWAAAVAEHRTQISDLRREIRATLDRFFPR